MKALILAAGFGSRMSPLTEVTPKPLLPFAGQPMIEILIRKLKREGFKDIAINCHAHAEQIQTYIALNHPDVYVSHEKQILGTAGAISHIRDWIDAEDLLIYNADILCDIDTAKLRSQFHKAKTAYDARAFMCVRSVRPKDPKSYIECDAYKRVKTIGAQYLTKNSYTFTGIHLLTPKFIAAIDASEFDIRVVYRESIGRNEAIGTFQHDGYWKDLGTPLDYWQAHNDFLAMTSAQRRQFIPEIAFQVTHQNDYTLMTNQNSELRPDQQPHQPFKNTVFMFNTCSIGKNTTINNCIVDDTAIGSDKHLSNQIIHKQQSLTIPIPGL